MKQSAFERGGCIAGSCDFGIVGNKPTGPIRSNSQEAATALNAEGESADSSHSGSTRRGKLGVARVLWRSRLDTYDVYGEAVMRLASESKPC